MQNPGIPAGHSRSSQGGGHQIVTFLGLRGDTLVSLIDVILEYGPGLAPEQGRKQDCQDTAKGRPTVNELLSSPLLYPNLVSTTYLFHVNLILVPKR